MDFTAIGSLHSYTQNMAMEMKWQQKKASGNFKADGTKTIEEWLKKQQEEASEAQTKDSKMENQIDLKMRSGKKLTSEEMEYLMAHSPQKYQKAREIEMERQAYEQDLKKCKTKEDVQRLKMSKVAASLSTVSSVKNNPNIPEGQKLGLIMQENQRMNAINDVTNEFVKEGGYAKLPTEAEKAKAEKDKKEAKMAEKSQDKDAAQTQEAEKADSAKEETSEEARADIGQDFSDTKPADTKQKASVKENKIATAKRELTREQAELTPEALKVKRAQAQAAYARTRTKMASKSVIDVKK